MEPEGVCGRKEGIIGIEDGQEVRNGATEAVDAGLSMVVDGDGQPVSDDLGEEIEAHRGEDASLDLAA